GGGIGNQDVALAVGDGQPAGLGVGGRVLGVVGGDRRMDVQRHRQAVAVGPVQEAVGVGEQGGVPLPPVPAVGAARRAGDDGRNLRPLLAALPFEVGVHRHGVERHSVGAEAAQQVVVVLI